MKKLIVFSIMVLTCVLACAQVVNKTFVWDPPTNSTDGSVIDYPILYNVYRLQGTNWIMLGQTTTTNITLSLGNSKYQVFVTAVYTNINPIIESDMSNVTNVDLRKPNPPKSVR